MSLTSMTKHLHKVPIQHFENTLCIPEIFLISSQLWNLKVTGIPLLRSCYPRMSLCAVLHRPGNERDAIISR